MLGSLFSRLGFGGDTGQANSHGRIALVLIMAGIAVVSPGIKDALVSFLNKHLDLGLSLGAPWFVGLFLVLAGLVVYFHGERGARRASELSDAPVGVFLALRHQSFEPLAAHLNAEAVPKRLGPRMIRRIECDQTRYLYGNLDLDGALREQARFASDLTASRRTDPDAAVGYYGIVHVPFQFLAGCSVSTWHQVALFELNRKNHSWHELKEGKGSKLDLVVETISRPADPAAISIRIAISYDVQLADIVDVVPAPFEDIRVGLTKPRLDAITHYDQVEMVCDAFRNVLDELHHRVDKSKSVHVFYAGPVSLGFSLGRQISRTIHHRVIAHNYNAQATPKYTWAVDVTKNAAITPALL